ncbi:hypothetical protein HJD18_13190 [Thermoleophilia bacterium SCSIO 60948]|nr:hypothetical protein HJD18_13190 [Thermoleophilia bacterium SCSIO 60948]
MPATRSESRISKQKFANSAQRALVDLRETARTVERRQNELEAALVARDAAIVHAAAAGLTRRKIAAAVGLSAARVQQVCNATSDGTG